jgi:predicted permease
MKTLRSWIARLFGLFRQDQRDREFAEEMESHLAMHIEDNLRLGMSPEESRGSAFIKLGGIDRVTEEYRDRRGLPFIENLFRDIHYACRTLYRNPGFTLTVVALLALGMGGVTAVFNPIYSLVVAPLPFPQPDRLVRIGGNIPLFNTYHSDFEKRELLARIFSNLTAYGIPPDFILRIRIPDSGKNVDIRPIVLVTEEFLETLGVRPIRGSVFGRKENGNKIIISHRFWQKEFMGQEDVIGKSVSILGQSTSYIIAGVMPETFDFPTGTDIWWCASGHFSGISNIQLVGRLRSGISERQAARDLEAFDFKPSIGMYGSAGPSLQSLHAVFYSNRLPLLWMIGAVAVLFLLLVCAGVSNFLIARGIRRKSEMTLRLILGAMRWKLICQLLRETLPIVLAGGAAGLVIAKFVGIWLQKQFPVLEGDEVAIPVKMVFFAALVLAVTIVSGLVPALRASGGDLNTRLKSASGSKRRFLSTQELLVGVQLSLTLALLIGAGALLRSLMDRVDFPIGWWSPQEIVVVSAEFPLSQSMISTEGRTRFSRFYYEAHRQLEAMPEVVSVGYLNPIPFSADAIRDTQTSSGMTVLYKDMPSAEASNLADLAERRKKPSIACVSGLVSPTGFDILGIPLIAGRPFTSTEIAN